MKVGDWAYLTGGGMHENFGHVVELVEHKDHGGKIGALWRCFCPTPLRTVVADTGEYHGAQRIFWAREDFLTVISVPHEKAKK